jgi:purine-binding chemotaxis protein CheW
METVRRKALTGPRYLSFFLNNEEYCIDILKIKEIMGMIPVTPVPQTPDFIKGVINLRGQIIPIIDLRLKFEMEEKIDTRRTCIVVVELPFEGKLVYMGIVVDTIKEVISIPPENISNVPYINAKIKSEYIKGIAEVSDSIKIVLDITKVLTSSEFVMVTELKDEEGV